ncbi:transglutaminase-like domain-containing protein [Cystobacter fuscus]
MLRLTFVSALLVAALACPLRAVASPAGGTGSRAPADYAIPKQLRYSFTLRNTTARPIAKVEFLTLAPVPRTSHQWLEKLTATHPYRVSRDSLGNELLRFEFETLPPYASRIISITADLKMAERGTEASGGDVARFTRPERYIESSDPRVGAIARAVRDPSALRTVRQTYDWVAANVQPSDYVPDDRGALYLLEQRRGDCTEFAYLVAALSRANHVPARPMGGYVLHGNSIVGPADYHNWAEVLVDGRWLIVDAHQKSFAEHETDYVAMRIISTEPAEDAPAVVFNRYEIRTPVSTCR